MRWLPDKYYVLESGRAHPRCIVITEAGRRYLDERSDAQRRQAFLAYTTGRLTYEQLQQRLRAVRA